MRRALILVACAVLAAGCMGRPVNRWHSLNGGRAEAGNHLTVLTIGDSRSSSGAWQAEMTRLLSTVGVTATVSNVAAGGTDCYYWVPRIYTLLDQYAPDLLVMACGTNDNPNATVFGEPKTGYAVRYVTEAAHARGVMMIPSLVQYSDPILAPGWLLTNEPIANDRLYANELVYQPAGWYLGIADFQRIPATATYLAAEPYPSPVGSIAIHPTARGHRWMGRIVFDVGAAAGVWPATSEPPLCDLYGHRLGYARPSSYVTCDG
jgi:hypothetical protein